MFYTTTDNAVERYQFKDGTEVAYTYDPDAMNPITDTDAHPVGVARMIRNSVNTDPYGYLDQYRMEQEDRENALGEIEWTAKHMRDTYGPEWWKCPANADEDTQDEHDNNLMELANYLDQYDQATDDDLHYFEFGQFEVVINAGHLARLMAQDTVTPEQIEDNARAAADDYRKWADGELLMVGITTPDGQTEYVGSIDEDPTEEIARRHCREWVGHSLEGVELGEPDDEDKPEQVTPEDAQAAAAHMGRQEYGPVNLDEGVPMDIYELFEQATGREYDHTSHADELQILTIAQAYETAHAHYRPRPAYGWTDFEPDQSSDRIPNKYILTIVTLDDQGNADEEVSTITHRATDMFPYDGELMNRKRAQADHIVRALNAYGPQPAQ